MMSGPEVSKECCVPECTGKVYEDHLCYSCYQAHNQAPQHPPALTLEMSVVPGNEGLGCCVPGCDGEHCAHGLCARCYQRFSRACKKNPELTVETWIPFSDPGSRSRKRSTRVCRLDECGRKHSSEGLCRSHYGQFRTGYMKDSNLTPETWVPPEELRKVDPTPSSETCRLDDCERTLPLTLGFCKKCYQRFYNAHRNNPALTPETWVPLKEYRRGCQRSSEKHCRIKGCGKSRLPDKSLCHEHYRECCCAYKLHPELNPNTWVPTPRPCWSS